MNRIEYALQTLQETNKKAFITYMTAGLPSMEGTKEIIKAQEEAGTDIIELGIPFSDPIADGPVIQAASFKSIQLGTSLKKILRMVTEVRDEGCQIPIVFMMYYNTVLYYGLKEFVTSCTDAGVDGLIIPDLPYEEQDELQKALEAAEGKTLLIQLVAPVSGQRIPMILKNARGFVYCVSSMGVTGQAGSFHKEVLDYLKEVKSVSRIPVMMGFGIRTAADVEPMRDLIDGAIVGSHFIELMEGSNYNILKIKEYIKTFKHELNT